MIKRRIETDTVWAEVKIFGSRTDSYYGFKDRTNVHGHTVKSGMEIIYQRNISGMNLVSGMLFVSGAILVPFL